MNSQNHLRFKKKCIIEINKQGKNSKIKQVSKNWIKETSKFNYSYHFDWLGLPIIQFPQDILCMQELIYKIKPDVIIETGVARGGSVLFYASILELISRSGVSKNSFVIGLDIDIRKHNLIAIKKQKLSKRINLIQGSSISDEVFNKVKKLIRGKKKIIVCLDSNHTHKHVLRELELYGPLVSKNSYIVVFDTIVEDMPKIFFKKKKWGRGNNPKTAVYEFLKNLKKSKINKFIIDKEINKKLLISVCPDGYLKKIN